MGQSWALFILYSSLLQMFYIDHFNWHDSHLNRKPHNLLLLFFLDSSSSDVVTLISKHNVPKIMCAQQINSNLSPFEHDYDSFSKIKDTSLCFESGTRKTTLSWSNMDSPHLAMQYFLYSYLSLTSIRWSSAVFAHSSKIINFKMDEREQQQQQQSKVNT